MPTAPTIVVTVPRLRGDVTRNALADGAPRVLARDSDPGSGFVDEEEISTECVDTPSEQPAGDVLTVDSGHVRALSDRM